MPQMRGIFMNFVLLSILIMERYRSGESKLGDNTLKTRI